MEAEGIGVSFVLVLSEPHLGANVVVGLGHRGHEVVVRGGTVVKLMRGWYPWLAQNCEAPVVLDMWLLAVNSAIPRKAAQSSCW